MSALRRQLYSLLYIEVVLDAIRPELCTEETELCKENVRGCLDRLHATLQMYDLSKIRVDDGMKKMQDVLKGMDADGMETLDFVCSCIELSARMYDQAPECKKRLWGDLEVALFALYQLADPDIELVGCVERGSCVGEKLKKVVFDE